MIRYQTKKIHVYLVTPSASVWIQIQCSESLQESWITLSYTDVCGNAWSYRQSQFSPPSVDATNSLLHSSYCLHSTSCKQFCSILLVGPQCIQFQIGVLTSYFGLVQIETYKIYLCLRWTRICLILCLLQQLWYELHNCVFMNSASNSAYDVTELRIHLGCHQMFRFWVKAHIPSVT
jgi:hypothetical protein